MKYLTLNNATEEETEMKITTTVRGGDGGVRAVCQI